MSCKSNSLTVEPIQLKLYSIAVLPSENVHEGGRKYLRDIIELTLFNKEDRGYPFKF